MRVLNQIDSSSASPAAACPLCGRPLAPELRLLLNRIDKPVAQKLRARHPDWVVEAGACPECVYLAAEQQRVSESRTPLHEELLIPYPVYSRERTGLIPTPLRVGANPHYSGQDVTLAFLDSGFYPHPDLTHPENRILYHVDATGAEIQENEDFSRPQLSSWHGLMTSSLAAGNGFKSGGLFRGIAYRANLVLVKTGHRGSRGINENDIQRALEWVIANQVRFNIRIVNISLGGDHPSGRRLSRLDRLVEEAIDRGMVVVAAAGNNGARRLVPPASAPSTITVGGLDDRNSFERSLWRMYHSNYGLGAHGQPKPEIIAPAMWLAAPMLPHTRVHNRGRLLWQLDKVFSWIARGAGKDHKPAISTGNGRDSQLAGMRRRIRLRMVDQKYIHPHYQHVDGTSMAAPVVSSVVAQMLEANPALSPAQVKEILVSTATPLAGITDRKQGAGVINASRAVALANRIPGAPLSGIPISPTIQAEGVTFTYFDPTCRAARVALVGSFNEWNPRGYDLRANLFAPLSAGLWQITIPSPPAGAYRYKFLVDDRWVEDPENSERVEDGYGGFASILEAPG